MKTSLRRYYPDQVIGLQAHTCSQPTSSQHPLFAFLLLCDCLYYSHTVDFCQVELKK